MRKDPPPGFPAFPVQPPPVILTLAGAGACNVAPFSPSPLPKPHTCRNCGLIGHLYKDCPHPTMSFGIICFRVRQGVPEYLMIQRKDSLSFMEFIRGKYQIHQVDYIKQLLAAMTHRERQFLLQSSFENLWNYVWCQPSIPKHTTEFLEAKRKFDTLRAGFLHQETATWTNLEELLKHNPSPYKEPEWGFPKGRRRLREEDVHCAVREFCEETGFKQHDLQLMSDLQPFEEIFYGTNNVLYRHVYYIARICGDSDKVLSIDPRNINQVREVRAIRWFPFEETMSHIRSHNRERKTLFQQAHLKVCDSLGLKGNLLPTINSTNSTLAPSTSTGADGGAHH